MDGIGDSVTEVAKEISRMDMPRILHAGIGKNHARLAMKLNPPATMAGIAQGTKPMDVFLPLRRHEGHLSRFCRERRKLWERVYFHLAAWNMYGMPKKPSKYLAGDLRMPRRAMDELLDEARENGRIRGNAYACYDDVVRSLWRN